jgi:predicted MFS family arabinose efflux permease
MLYRANDAYAELRKTDLKTLYALRPALSILMAASLMLSLAMGLRQSLGIFMSPLTRDVGITVSDFTLAIAIQNLVWGALQPFAGAWAVRIGYRALMVAGALLYVLGLVLLAGAQGVIAVTLGAGLAIGSSLACCGSAMAMAVSARAVHPTQRSLVLGIVSAVGSLGALLSAPLGQALSQGYGWRMGVIGFVALAVFMLPAAWVAGRSPSIKPPPQTAVDQQSARQVLVTAWRNKTFVVLTVAFFVCGMQLVFLTTHLPAYLAICGMDPMLSAQALGVIGGFNVLGSIFFGWAGGHWNKLALLGSIYIMRSLALAWYFMATPTPMSTLVFAAVMGFLWLGVAPLVTGWIVDTFGLRWQAMLGGVAFVSHQLGSFVGAYGGGLIFDAFGSYSGAWRGGVAMGLAAGIVQVAFALRFKNKPQVPTLS